MLSKEERHYYNRHLLLKNVGEQGQLALKKSKVLVVGAGGLGCPVLTYLCGAGIGHIGITDGDTVSVSNLHRQTLYGHRHIGLLKTDAAIQQLSDINPYIELIGYSKNLMAGNVREIFNDYDIIVDATDNFPVRYLINDACVILNKPYVFASVDRFQGQLSVLNYKDGPTYRCIFPEPPNPETAPGCSEVGVLGVLPGILGSLQANEVIKMIIGSGDVLSGKILMVDSLTNGFYTIDVQKVTNSYNQVLDLESGVADSEYFSFCNPEKNSVENISVEQVRIKISNQENLQFVDVRNGDNNDYIESSLRIPLSKIDQKIDIIDKKAPIVVYCDKGIDSRKAVEKFKNYGLKNVYSLFGGLRAWNAADAKK